MYKFFSVAVVLVVLTSCVSNKRTVYFQGESSLKSDVYKLNNEPYKLQVSDVLIVNIKALDEKMVALFKPTETVVNNNQNSNAFNDYALDRNGNIRLPYLGEINVLGYTVKEVREKIESGLKLYIKNTDGLFVQVKLAGIRFVVTGEVGSPGTVNLQQEQVSIVEALANAGEINGTGDRQNVEILRKTVDGWKKYKIDLTTIDVFNSELYYIKPNDIIYVNPLGRKSWGLGTTGLSVFTTFISIFSVVTSTILIVKTF
ncbi:MAG: polysaccharide biosynthesis/export family protein [Flavobacteriaceae bacterium]|nr:polysaccharide biosynthesis/export family protein [Flavobacteriaceae bacterium]